MKLKLFVKLLLGSLVINYTYSAGQLKIKTLVRLFNRESLNFEIQIKGEDKLNEFKNEFDTFLKKEGLDDVIFLYACIKKEDGLKFYSFDIKESFQDKVKILYIVFGQSCPIKYDFKYYDIGDENYKETVDIDTGKKHTKDEIINMIKKDIKAINDWFNKKSSGVAINKGDLYIICNYIDGIDTFTTGGSFMFVYKGELKDMDFINQLSVDDLKNTDYGFCIKPKKQTEKEEEEDKNKTSDNNIFIKPKETDREKKGEEKNKTSNNNGSCCCF